MERVDCDLCGGSNFTPFIQSKDYINRTEGLFQTVKCSGCGLVFTNPRPRKDEILNFYPDSYPSYSQGESSTPSKFVKGIYRKLLEYYFGYMPHNSKGILSKIILSPVSIFKLGAFYTNAVPAFVEGGRLLEIGAAHGKFLHEMQGLGWEVNGIELSSYAAGLAKELYGLDVINTDIDDAKFDMAYFDVIIMKMVLEHVYSPDKTLETIARWLKPGGHLIITVPDISGIEAKLFKKYFFGLHLPNHLYHFSPETIRKYFVKHELSIEKIYHIKDTRDFKRSVDILLEEKPSAMLPRFLNSRVFKFVRKPLLLLLFSLRRSSRMTIYAKSEKARPA
jgi:2-polyprenyl-3-methyl-5-hydroxy-6-metoxy-1,4-benzoquinol methylase